MAVLCVYLGTTFNWYFSSYYSIIIIIIFFFLLLLLSLCWWWSKMLIRSSLRNCNSKHILTIGVFILFAKNFCPDWKALAKKQFSVFTMLALKVKDLNRCDYIFGTTIRWLNKCNQRLYSIISRPKHKLNRLRRIANLLTIFN